MSPNPTSVRPNDSVAEAFERMLGHRLRHLLVVDDDGKLVGLVTHRALLRNSLMEPQELRPGLERSIERRIRVAEVMTSKLETARPDQSLAAAARVMFDQKFGCLPVLDGSRVVGILTEADFVRHFAEAGASLAANEA